MAGSLNLGQLFFQIGAKTEGLQKADKAARQFAKNAEKNIGRAGTATKKLETTTKKFAKSAEKDYRRVSRSANKLKGVIAGIISLEAIRRVVLLADSFNILQQRLRTATRDTGDYVQVSAKIFAISKANGTALQTNVTLFQSLARSAPDLAATNKQMLILAEAVGQLAVIGGSSANEIKHGLRQFTQGLSAGIFRAEEFNSLLENVPELAVRIAKGMDLPIGQLRKMVLSGEVLSKDVFHSLLKQAPEIAEQFKEIENNIQRSSASLKNSFGKFVSDIDQVFGITIKIADALQSFALILDNLDVSGLAVGFDRAVAYIGAATGAVLLYGAGVVIAIGLTELLAFAIKALRVAVIASGIGILALLVAEAAYQMGLAVEETNAYGAALHKIGRTSVVSFKLLQSGSQIFWSWIEDKMAEFIIDFGIFVLWVNQKSLELVTYITSNLAKGLDYIGKGLARLRGKIGDVINAEWPDLPNPFSSSEDVEAHIKTVITLEQRVNDLLGVGVGWLKTAIGFQQENIANLLKEGKMKRDEIRFSAWATHFNFKTELANIDKLREDQRQALVSRIKDNMEALRMMQKGAEYNSKEQEKAALELAALQQTLDDETARRKRVKGNTAAFEIARKSLLSQTQLAVEQYQLQLKAFRNHLDESVISQEQYFEFIIALTAKHQDDLAKIKKDKQDKIDKPLNKLKKELEDQANALSEHLRTEVEIVEANRAKQLAVLEASQAAGMKLEISYVEARLRIQNNYTESMKAIAQEERDIILDGLQGRAEGLTDSLRTETEILQKTRDDQMAILLQAYSLGIELELGYRETLLRIQGTYNEAVAALNKKKMEAELGDLQKRLESLTEGYMTESELEVARHASSLQLLTEALEAKLLTRMQYNQLIAKEEEKNAEKMAKISKDNAKATQKQEFVNAFLGVELHKKAGDATAKEQGEAFKNQISEAAKESKAFFQLKKALALATALIEAPKAVLSAFTIGTEFGGPQVGAIFASVAAAATAVQVATIANSSFNGGKATGGTVFGGGTYRVNENGPELLSSGGKDYLMMGGQRGMVTPNDKLGSIGGSSNVTVNVYPQAGQEARIESTETDSGTQVEVILEKIEDRIAAGVLQGGSPLADALQLQFGLNRAAGTR